jgi:HTH-type transcriptional regulator/antitoxin HigA
MTIATFEPRWASSPANSILRAIERLQWSLDDFADRLGVGDPEMRRILSGERSIDAELAHLLAAALGGSSDFWLAREAQFEESLSALSADEFARKLPLDQMISMGWIDSSSSWRTQARSALDFFGAESVEDAVARLDSTITRARYRASASFDSDAVKLAAWMRQAERIAQQRPLSQWNPQVLSSAIDEIRGLTRMPDPRAFLPVVEDKLALSGVALIVLRPIKGLAVSGVSFRSSEDTPTIALSARHMSDDHLWFTLFHEIGHLLLHPDEDIFVDELDRSPKEGLSVLEAEANKFAAEVLVPFGLEELSAKRTQGPAMRDVMRFAVRHGVAPGIVVGQLQNRGKLRPNQLNKLKRRYRWEGGNLHLGAAYPENRT